MLIKFLKNALVVSFALTFTACTFLAPASTPNTTNLEKEEQVVFSFFVSGSTGTVVILQDTSTNISSDDPQQSVDFIRSGFKSVSIETLNNFLERNSQPSQLSPDMQPGVNYVLLSTDELSTIMQQTDGWSVFHEKYPNSGYTQFSRVGFNNSLDQAVIYVGNVAGPMMGAGFYYLMDKKDGQWVIKEQVMTWIS